MRLGVCGTGLGALSLPPKGKVAFGVCLPGGDWDKFRVGVTWYKAATPRKQRKPGASKRPLGDQPWGADSAPPSGGHRAVA